MVNKLQVKKETQENPTGGLQEYLKAHQKDSIFERECGKETLWYLFLHDGRELVGRIRNNEIFEFDLSMEDGNSEKIHKVNVNFVCPASFQEEIHKQMKRNEAVAEKAEGPHFSTRYRHHIKNKSLYPLMNRREVLFFTMLKGEVLRGVVSAFSRYEIDLSLKRGVPVVLLRHAVFDVRDKKNRCYLKKVVEKTGQYS